LVDCSTFPFGGEQGVLPLLEDNSDLDFDVLLDAEFDVALESVGDFPTGSVQASAMVFSARVGADDPERATATLPRAAFGGPFALGFEFGFTGGRDDEDTRSAWYINSTQKV
jgi:hypothetical protein